MEKLYWRFPDGNVADLLDARRFHAPPNMNKKLQSHSSMMQRLALETEMEGHQGCVNAIAWSSNGSLLVSGSDDTKINIWSYANRELLHSIDTGHSANIFCTKFVPETSDEVVVSGAGDAEVRVFNLSRLSGRRPREIAMEPTAVYQCHSRRVKKLAVEIGNPNVIWSASEDGTLRQHDFRECSSCPPAGSANQECHNVLLDLRCGAKKSLADPPKHPLALKSCDISSTRPHQLLVGGSDAFARLYDRRMLPPLSSCQTKTKPPPYITMFCPLHLADNRKSSMHLTHVAFSPNGEEVLLSYSGEHVYQFDVHNDNESPMRYTSGDIWEQLYLPPLHKKAAQQPSQEKKLSANMPSKKNNLCRIDMCKKLMQLAEKSLEIGTDFLYGIEACNEVLDGTGPDIGDEMRHDCLCIRAGLYLKRKWKNDVYMAIRDCNRARHIDFTSYQSHLYMAEALIQLGRLKEAFEYAELSNNLVPPNSECAKQVQNIKDRLTAAEAEKNKKDREGPKVDARHGRLRSLSDVLFRSDLSGSSQETREDSDYDDEMELDFETSVSGDERRENEAGVVRGSLSLRFHRRDDSPKEHCGKNGSLESSQCEDSAYQPDIAIDMRQRYVAHCNVGTDIKQASFLGQQGIAIDRSLNGSNITISYASFPRRTPGQCEFVICYGYVSLTAGEFVASGSDDGRWFIWERRTGRLIKMLAGDGAVVNCIQSHPYDSAIATSGIDNTVKIWIPHAQDPSMVAGGPAGPTADIMSAIENNQRKLSRNREILLPFEFFERFRMQEFAEGTLPPFECAQS